MRKFWALPRRQLTLCLLAGALFTVSGANAQAAARADGVDELRDGLIAALQATSSNHPALASESAKVLAADYAASAERTQWFPSLSVQAQQFASGGRSSLSGEDLTRPAIVRIRQPLWSFGRIKNSIAVANAGLDTGKADQLRVHRQLLEATAAAYAAVRGSTLQMDVARVNVAEHDRLLERIRGRVKGQLASSADERLATTRLLQAKGALMLATSEFEGRREELIGLTQVPVGTSQPVPGELLGLAEDNELIDTAISEHAEVRLRQQQLAEAEAEVKLVRRSSLPTIFLQADRLNDQPALVDDNQVSLVFEASLDSFGFGTRRRTGEAQARQRAAEAEVAATRVELRRELSALQRNRRLQSDMIELHTLARDDLQALLASYQSQYESGTKSWLDLLNIQRELFDQERQLVQARNDWIVQSLQLTARTGGLDALVEVSGPSDG